MPPDAAGDREQATLPPLRHGWALAAIVLLGLFAYSNALRGAFVFDDVRQIRDNPLVRDLGNFLSSLSAYRAHPNRWVGYLSFALNYRVGGLAVAGYHLVNVVIHVANALLVYALVVAIFRTPRLRASSLSPSSRAIALVAAALFVTHPIQTQAVSYVVQRLTSLATTFYLATVVLYAHWRLRDGEVAPRRRRVARGIAIFATAVLAMKTKEIAFTLPLAVALYEVSFFEGIWRTRLRHLTPVLASLPIIPLTTLHAYGASSSDVLSRIDLAARLETPLPRLDYLATQLVVVAKYLALLVFPAGQSVDHDVPVYRSIAQPRVAASLALLVALAALAAFLHRRTSSRPGRAALDPAVRVVGFGIAWFFLGLLVESSVIPIADVMYEHRVYLPSAGLFAAAATALAALARRLPRVDVARTTALAGVLVAVVLSIVTLRRNEVWTNDLTLWSDAALKAPRKARPFANLGTALALAGRPELGARALRQAIVLDPDSPYARAQLATTLLTLGRAAEAEPELRAALRLAPDDPESLYNLGTLLWASGRRHEASTAFRHFLEVAPAAYADARRVATARVEAAGAR